MNFASSEVTVHVAHTARQFALQYIKPHVMEWDEAQIFPTHIFKQLGIRANQKPD